MTKPIYEAANAQAEAAKRIPNPHEASAAWDRASTLYLEAEATDTEGTPSFMMPQSDTCARQALRCLEEAGLKEDAEALRSRYATP